MKLALSILILIITTTTFAKQEDFTDFAYSLEKRLFIRAGHILDVTDKIFLARPSLLQRWGVLGANAEASYNGWTNTIILKEKNLVEDQGRWRVKSYNEFYENDFNLFATRASTIFHEIAHADFDVYLERSPFEEVREYIVTKIPLWFKQNFRRLNKKTATQELFGYTAGEIVSILDQKIESIHLAHGLHYHADKCFNKKALINIAKNLDLKRNLQFKKLREEDFEKVFLPKTIYINGRDIDIDKIPKAFTRPLMSYFKGKYGIPTSSAELIGRMNNSHYKSKLKKCYQFLYED